MRTRKFLEQGSYDTSALTIVDPVGYLNMVWLLDHCSAVLTDSGGLQKEAYFFSKPCVTLRDNTERPETVQIGANRLAGTDPGRIVMEGVAADGARGPWDNPFGDGKASQRILDEMARFAL